MTRKETIDKYIDAFLKGRSQNAADKFRAKAEHLQYASIMQWRRRRNKEENTPKSIKDIVELLRKAAALVNNAPDITAEDKVTIESEVEELRNTLESAYRNARSRRIDELEAQQQQIAARLEQLRAE